ncbi:hypothetical protein MPTK1_5g19760 [Marchantia polymorpha subsp. ruderalis]|uniref:Uncharacterized protein n=2 Tax=Marchantia polymorpha TaxID=3197 RepID=A0AAF6BK64_MARPO|nr:hypothetical protein MARPO_0134s0034 [Marchantia polymorpha]BBN12398.1 hypothetical protein Mp_5g19760 [Marchantia polymorpha subsp. ruderalis]|eukprot:PTQ29823.1 hypothetical protein MARPO_0134s0034 [Marchantia polymorpha]
MAKGIRKRRSMPTTNKLSSVACSYHLAHSRLGEAGSLALKAAGWAGLGGWRSWAAADCVNCSNYGEWQRQLIPSPSPKPKPPAAHPLPSCRRRSRTRRYRGDKNPLLANVKRRSWSPSLSRPGPETQPPEATDVANRGFRAERASSLLERSLALEPPYRCTARPAATGFSCSPRLLALADLQPPSFASISERSRLSFEKGASANLAPRVFLGQELLPFRAGLYPPLAPRPDMGAGADIMSCVKEFSFPIFLDASDPALAVRPVLYKGLPVRHVLRRGRFELSSPPAPNSYPTRPYHAPPPPPPQLARFPPHPSLPTGRRRQGEQQSATAGARPSSSLVVGMHCPLPGIFEALPLHKGGRAGGQSSPSQLPNNSGFPHPL